MLRSSQVIRNLPIFICPGDTQGDTKIRAVFVTTSFRQCTRSTLQNNLRLQLGDEIAAVRIALFVRRFRCTRSEFLEARIIPERIKHRIEPEERSSERHVLSQRAIVRYREQFL